MRAVSRKLLSLRCLDRVRFWYPVEMTSYGYTAVPGSERLKTRPVGAGPAAELEALDPAVATGRMVEGEWLARCVVRDRFVPVLLDVYDRLALDQDANEQALYGHLWRLSLADERNWCRVSLKELQQRTRLSERRLNKALAGLVAKGHVRLVERDRRGTLYRVMLPHEVFQEPDGDVVHMPRPRAAPMKPSPSQEGPSPHRTTSSPTPQPPVPPRKASSPPPPPTPQPSAVSPPPSAPRAPKKGDRFDTLLDSTTVGTLARSFVERFGEAPGRTRAEVVEEILGLLEDGCSLPEAAEKLAAFGRGSPKRTPLSELRRYLSRAD